MTEFSIENLTRYFNKDGGVPYQPGASSLGEPTLLMLLAMIALRADERIIKPLFDWAIRQKNPNGSFPMGGGFQQEGVWLTPHFAIAMHHLGKKEPMDESIKFILEFRSLTFQKLSGVDLDPGLVGWSWVPGTFGWVEPTSWALLALRFAGLSDHQRSQEGRKLLKNRCIPKGGWNYGNKAVFSNELLPFWDTTALAILALDERDASFLEPQITLLENSLEEIRSLYSLSWVCLCLEKFGRNVATLKDRIRGLLADESYTLNLAHSAVGLLATAEKRVLTP